MATTGDILAPKLLADGTFEETVLTPAAIGAAPGGINSGGQVQQARELFDTTTGEVAFRITGSEVVIPEEAEGAILALSFRNAIGAASLVNGTVPASQLPPLSFQTTRHDGDGTTTAFAPPGTLTASDSASAILVTVNGVTQEPGSDYTLNIATNRVVLTAPLPLGDKIVITRPLLLPSNSTLTAEQLGALTATSVIDGGSF
jgi:hypothetical protein